VDIGKIGDRGNHLVMQNGMECYVLVEKRSVGLGNFVVGDLGIRWVVCVGVSRFVRDNCYLFSGIIRCKCWYIIAGG